MEELKKQQSKARESSGIIDMDLAEIKNQLGLNLNFSDSRIEDAYDLLLEISQLLKTKERKRDQLTLQSRNAG